MQNEVSSRRQLTLGALAVLGLSCLSTQAFAAPEYHPIKATMADKTITLTGNDLTVEQVVQIARYGAKVQLSPEAKKRTQDTFNMMNQGAAEGMAIYLFNRGGGNQREVVQFTGDPLSPENRPRLEERVLNGFKNGANRGNGPEIADEDVARAIMLVRANQMTYLPASPGMMQGLIDLMNNDITPVMKSRGGTGEALGPTSGNIAAALVGAGEVYMKGVRMPASEALQKAGLKPIVPAPGDGTTGTVNSDVAGMSALLVADAQRLLEWTDLVYAIDLNGMNSSVTPLFAPVQANRPYPWINWTAARVLDMMKGSYLFNDDKTRIIQDPESMRAGYVRQGAAWEEWAHLKDAVTIQMNWSEHNPAVKVDWSGSDSWELATPQAQKYFVKGSAANNNKHGFIFSNANWDPYPLGNRIEAFTIALANMMVAVMLRQERFDSTFFTVVKANEVIKDLPARGGGGAGGWANHEVWQRIQGLMNPVPPEGYSSDPEGVEELDAETLFKVGRAEQAVDESWMLVASDLVVGTRWIDVRKAQDATRQFGPAVTAAWEAFRKAVPLKPVAGGKAPGVLALEFIQSTPAASFITGAPAAPAMMGPSALAKGSKSLSQASMVPAGSSGSGIVDRIKSLFK